MSGSITDALRNEIRKRAGDRCEYCLIHSDDVMLSHEVDHIVAIKHGGPTEIENLAWACFLCNRYKGSDIASIDPNSDELSPLFHPRRDNWSEHFQLRHGQILGKSAAGRVTANLLQFNTVESIQVRRLLQSTGRIP